MFVTILMVLAIGVATLVFFLLRNDVKKGRPTEYQHDRFGTKTDVVIREATPDGQSIQSPVES